MKLFILKYIFFSLLLLTGIFLYFGNSFASDTSDKDDVLIYVSPTGTARGYDLLWKVYVSGTYSQESEVAYYNGIAYVAGRTTDTWQGHRDLFAINVASGEILDTYEIGSSYATPVIDTASNTLYIGTGVTTWNPDSGWSDTYGLYSFDLSNVTTTGFSLNWYQPVSGGTLMAVLMDNNNLYYEQGVGNKIYAFAKNDGSEVWNYSTSSTAQSYFGLLRNDNLYYTNSYQGGSWMYNLNKSDGSLVWRKSMVGRLWDNSLTYDADNDVMYMSMYYSSSLVTSYGVDGVKVWQAITNGRSLSYSAYHNNVAFFSDLSGYVYAKNSSDGSEVWTVRLGDGINDGLDISSPTITNSLLFAGTQDTSDTSNDTRGKGKLYILNEDDGSVVWQYHESDLGNIMSPATIADGIFFTNTNYWYVYAFDVGDGDSDWVFPNYDQDNTRYCASCITTDRYVQSTCSNNGSNTTCSISNLYQGRAIETKMKMENQIISSVALSDGTNHIFVNSSTVYLPSIAASSSLSNVVITTGTSYSSTLPQLTTTTPSTLNVLSASYNSSDGSVSITTDGSSSITSATISNYNKPFQNATSSIDSIGTTTLSASGLSGTSAFSSVNMTVSPNTGSVDLRISNWDSSSMSWSETSSNNGTETAHTIGGLTASSDYDVLVDGANYGTYRTDSSGNLSFTYDRGYSTKSFSVKPSTATTVPLEWFDYPFLPFPTLDNLLGGFKILINNGQTLTKNKKVNLKLFSGDNTTSMAISNDSDFDSISSTGQIPFESFYEWDLCKNKSRCPDGTYTVYAMFFTKYGRGTTAVKDNIVLDSSGENEDVAEILEQKSEEDDLIEDTIYKEVVENKTLQSGVLNVENNENKENEISASEEKQGETKEETGAVESEESKEISGSFFGSVGSFFKFIFQKIKSVFY